MQIRIVLHAHPWLAGDGKQCNAAGGAGLDIENALARLPCSAFILASPRRVSRKREFY